MQHVATVVPKSFSTTNNILTSTRRDHLLHIITCQNCQFLEHEQHFYENRNCWNLQTVRHLKFQRNSLIWVYQMTIKWSHSFRKNFRCGKYKVEAPKTGSKSKYLYFSSAFSAGTHVKKWFWLFWVLSPLVKDINS